MPRVTESRYVRAMVRIAPFARPMAATDARSGPLDVLASAWRHTEVPSGHFRSFDPDPVPPVTGCDGMHGHPAQMLRCSTGIGGDLFGATARHDAPADA